MAKTLIILANGFEEIEAVAVIDMLRRANIDVTVASLGYNAVTSARQVTVIADTDLFSVKDALFDMVILPGGEPGTTNLENSEMVTAVLKHHIEHKKWIAAICAAPRILNKLGFLKDKKATSFPGTKPLMTECIYQEEAVIQDGLFITSRGAGTSFDFGFKLVEVLISKEQSDELKTRMVFSK